MFDTLIRKGALSVISAALAFTALAGCTVNPRKDFDQVQNQVFKSTGQHIVWNAGTAEDVAIKRTMDELLKHELTADQVVQVALLNNADLQATYEDLGIAQADLVQAGLLANPVISAEIRFPGRPRFPVEVNLEEQFLQVFFLPLRKKMAQDSFDRARAMVTDAVTRRAAETRAAFYRLQGAQQLLALHQTALEAAEANLEAARRMRQAGNTRDLDLANAEAWAAQARLELTESQAQVAEGREDLNLLMGLWGSQTGTWSLSSRLPEPAADVAPETLESLALAQRQDLLAARSATLVAARAAGIANYAALFSGAMFGAHFQRDAEVKATVGPSITVPIPIFDQGQAATALAAAEFRQSQDRFAALAVQVQSEVRKAHIRMATALQRATYFKDVVLPLRQRIVEQTQLQFNGMFIGLSGLLQAKTEQINAGEKYVQALSDYWVARADLEAAIGGRLPDTPATIPAASTASATMPAPMGTMEMPQSK